MTLESKTYADAIMQAMREPLLVLDGGFRVKVAVHSFCETFKVTPEQTLGRSLYELGNGQWDIPALRKLLNELLPGGGDFHGYQVEHDFPDIGRRTMLLNARRLHNGDASAKLILLVIEDVTERRKAEAELARKCTWFQAALDSIGDAVIATDADARVTFMNPTAERMTGWDQKAAAGKPLHDVFHIVNEDTRDVRESPVTKVIRLGAIVGLGNHTLLIARDGAECLIDDSAAPIRDEGNGNIIGVVMVFHDITGRRAAEHKLEVSEIRYRRLFEAAHDGILILNTSTSKITDVNPFMLELLGFPREHFIGKELWEIGIFLDKEANQTAMRKLHQNGSIRFEDLPLQDRNGHRHPVEIVANVYQEGDEQVIQCNIRDIADRVLFEREREALLANEQASRLEAEAANRSKDLFLATLSHEVRTPLNAILGWASILRSGDCSVADVQEGMEVIERNCRAQAQLIEDVLDISRIVSGKLRLEIRACELVEVINAAIDVVRPAAQAKRVRIEATLDPAASHVSCDTDRMRQVVWNLLANAVKFSPDETTVRVTLARDRSAARIQVSDEGQGISREFLPYVFDRFRQADSSTRRKLGGLGLGLSIVKHIVEVHGGTVRAESAGEGHGATFTVNLPVRAVQIDEGDSQGAGGSGDTATADVTPVRLDGLRVMVVDDEADARRLLGKVLGEAGAVVTAAGSVAEAMEALAAADPEVLVSDIALPGQDGFDLIRQVRGAGRTARELPAVALTAFAHKEDRRRVLLAGFQVHVPKPIDPHDLTAVIATLAGRTG
jgi:PAS domain S-box-containing protein